MWTNTELFRWHRYDSNELTHRGRNEMVAVWYKSFSNRLLWDNINYIVLNHVQLNFALDYALAPNRWKAFMYVLEFDGNTTTHSLCNYAQKSRLITQSPTWNSQRITYIFGVVGETWTDIMQGFCIVLRSCPNWIPWAMHKIYLRYTEFTAYIYTKIQC